MKIQYNESLLTTTNNMKTIQAGQHVVLSEIPQLTIFNANDPLQRAKKWYCRMGCPSRDEMKSRISQQAGKTYYDIKLSDVDLLPWNHTKKIIKHHKPGRGLEKEDLNTVRGYRRKEEPQQCKAVRKPQREQPSAPGRTNQATRHWVPMAMGLLS